MEIGQRLRQARIQAGLSQRELSGDRITRNMLSLIENGAAQPSVDTLRYLAQRLGKDPGYFLDDPDDTVADAREAFSLGRYGEALTVLEAAEPEPEICLLRALCHMALGEEAIREGRLPHARQLLERARQAGHLCPYFPSLEGRWQLLWAMAGGEDPHIPDQDDILLLRAREALERGDALRAGQYLDACEDRGSPGWSLLRGRALFSVEDWSGAADCFRKAEHAFPRACAGYLEQCCERLEDYKGAYRYAKLLRQW